VDLRVLSCSVFVMLKALIEGLVTGWKPDQVEASWEERFDNIEHSYRVEVPPDTTALRLSSQPCARSIYVAGQLAKTDRAGRITFPKLDYQKHPFLPSS